MKPADIDIEAVWRAILLAFPQLSRDDTAAALFLSTLPEGAMVAITGVDADAFDVDALAVPEEKTWPDSED